MVIKMSEYEVPDLKVKWSKYEKIAAKGISWSLMVSIIIMMVGGLWTLIDVLLLYLGDTSSFISIFLQLTAGVQILLIFTALIGLLFLGIAFYMFIKKGFKFILNLLFKIED